MCMSVTSMVSTTFTYGINNTEIMNTLPENECQVYVPIHPPLHTQGRAGDRGAKGPRGGLGNAGPRGEAGEAGPDGVPGRPGGAGPPGLAGDRGFPGEHGSQGGTGKTGVAGDKGDKVNTLIINCPTFVHFHAFPYLLASQPSVGF